MIKNVIAFLALALILIAVNASIYDKEQHLSTGRTVFLELAPFDPRSLMQGDYMALWFEAATQLRKALPKRIESGRIWRNKVAAEDGWAVLELDENGVGHFAGVATTPESAESHINLAFRIRSGIVKFATNAFFFQEGTAEVYEAARYGEFRVNEQGEPLLVGLRDKDLVELVPVSKATFTP
ncbi:MAG: GDYXXLXY domain-containing protein [Gammaproteobacteria bacterium]